MDITFVYESRHPIEVRDGLWAALEVLGRTHSIKRVNIATDNYLSGSEFVLGWGAFGSHVDIFCQKLPSRKGLCIGGNTCPPSGALNYDVLFYETKWYRPQINFHPNIIHAFGYNADIYKNINVTRDIDYLGVGAYALWKRWDKMLNKKGNRRIIGEYQVGNPEESQEIWETLENGGVLCKTMQKPETLMFEYNRAKTVYLPANIYGGGERAVLEARACGCKVEVEPDNPKLQEVIEMPLWTHEDYAKRLEEGICG